MKDARTFTRKNVLTVDKSGIKKTWSDIDLY